MSETLRFERYGGDHTGQGVTRVALAPGAIHVQFHDANVYVYSNAVSGREHVAVMKQLARSGKGLSTYISQHVRDRYERRYRIDMAPPL